MRSLVSAPPRGRLLTIPQHFSIGGLAFAAALPIVFLHVDYQPSVVVHAGGASATLKLQDAAVLLVVVAALVAIRRGGLGPLRRGLPVWITGLALLVWIVAAVFYPLASARAYAWKSHLVTAGEFGEYMLLAPAVPLLLRRRSDQLLCAAVIVAWSVLATAVAFAQWCGWTGVGGWGRGFRQPSFLGTHDFAALSGMTIGLGIVALLWGATGPTRRAAWVAVASGTIGFVLAGASAGVVGLVPAAIVVVFVAVKRHGTDRRIVVASLVATAIASLGVVALRTSDFDQFFRFLGAKHSQASSNNIQTYSQRTVLAYIGLRIWLHHPLVGVGWDGSEDPAVFERELPAAHKRFPNVAPIAFPSPTRRYGVQVAYVQALADMGVIGLLLFLAVFAAALVVAARRAVTGVVTHVLAVFWIVLALGLWAAQGLVAGIPLDALTFLSLGAATL